MSLIPVACVLSILALPPAEPLAARLNDLKATCSSLKLEGKGGMELALANSEKALARGDVPLALYHVRAVIPNLLAYKTYEQDGDKIKTAEELDKYWKAGGVVLEDLKKQFGTRQYKGMPMVVRGMIEEAVVQADTTYLASLLYGKEAQLSSGVFYTRNGQGFYEFAMIAADQPVKAKAPMAVPKKFDEALESFRGEVLDAYIQHGATDVPERTLIISAHARIKVVDDLLDRAMRDGAMTVLAQGRYELSLAKAMFAKVKPSGDLSPLVSKLRGELSGIPDPSVAELYLNLAAEKLPLTPEPDQLRAKLLLEEVVPFILGVLK